MNTNNNQPITAALPELAVIGNLVYENYDASRLVDAIIREDLREEHFADAACRAAFSAIMRNESAGRDRVANLCTLCATSGVEFAERAIAAVDVIEPYAIARIAKVAEEGRKRLVAEAVNTALLSRASDTSAFVVARSAKNLPMLTLSEPLSLCVKKNFNLKTKGKNYEYKSKY